MSRFAPAVLVMAVWIAGYGDPAHADWQYTKFGMTLDQVVAASEGAAKAEPDPKRDRSQQGVVLSKALATAQYQFKDFTFDVAFGFDPKDSLLNAVSLRMKEGGRSCSALLGELTNAYGKPDIADRGSVVTKITWRSESTKNVVELVQVSDKYCGIAYTPLAMPGKGGL